MISTKKNSNKYYENIFLLLIFFISSSFIYAQGWEELESPNPPEARSGHTLVTLPDGRVVMFGGRGENDALFNDLNIFRDTWQPVTPMDSPPTARKNHAAWCDSDKVYIFGGNDNSTLLNDLWSYDLNTNSWSNLQPSGSQPDPRENVAAFKYNGDLYFLGGQGESSRMSDVWYYKIQENSWNKWGHSPTSVAGGAAFISGDDLFISGISSWTISADLVSKQWRDFQSNPMPPPRVFAASTQTENQGYLIGGEGSIYQDTWSFEFSSESWTQLTDLPFPLKNVSATIYENKILLFGGLEEDGTLNNKTLGYTLAPTDVDDDELSYTFSLAQNYPNPFNPSTSIMYQVSSIGKVSIKIFDILGREIKTLVNNIKTPGSYEVTFDASNLPTGVYFYTLESVGNRVTKKMILLR